MLEAVLGSTEELGCFGQWTAIVSILCVLQESAWFLASRLENPLLADSLTCEVWLEGSQKSSLLVKCSQSLEFDDLIGPTSYPIVLGGKLGSVASVGIVLIKAAEVFKSVPITCSQFILENRHFRPCFVWLSKSISCRSGSFSCFAVRVLKCRGLRLSQL